MLLFISGWFSSFGGFRQYLTKKIWFLNIKMAIFAKKGVDPPKLLSANFCLGFTGIFWGAPRPITFLVGDPYNKPQGTLQPYSNDTPYIMQPSKKEMAFPIPVFQVLYWFQDPGNMTVWCLQDTFWVSSANCWTQRLVGIPEPKKWQESFRSLAYQLGSLLRKCLRGVESGLSKNRKT